eukprot:TRINITY_DN17553_c0_g1_i1.p1 TRINITY_DN17553_c0_g1~~TRINITY_DN17553_c0_g1_i1.p1  ORF type:complete len:520 (+),score=114.71 TRINITY_DN17553_c0_g1_i1:88-1560(+)
MLRKSLVRLSSEIVAEENTAKKAWHVRGGLGGTKLAKQREKKGLEGMGLMEAIALKDSVEAVMGKDHYGSKILADVVEKEAVLNRRWTDEEFQDGEQGNEERVTTLETQFKEIYSKTESLDDSVTLGHALDLVGAYLKNYKIAKAAAIMDEALPKCRTRGGVWLIKALNHASTVRMKQQRHAEALIMLRELEACIPYKPEEAIELFDMLYRNIGMALQALNKSDQALPYYLKCAHLKGEATWWDRWDVGYCMATVAFNTSNFDLLRKASATIAEAIPLHQLAEPGEHVMHAKICQALGDCYLALATLRTSSPTPAEEGEEKLDLDTGSLTVLSSETVPVLESKEYLSRAASNYKEAHTLFTDNCGHTNDLSGWCAASVALCLVQQSKHRESLEYLQHAIYVYSKSDIPKLPQLQNNLELLTTCFNQVQDPQVLSPFLPLLDTILTRLESPLLHDEEGSIAKIKRTAAVVFASSSDEGYRDKGLELLQKFL